MNKPIIRTCLLVLTTFLLSSCSSTYQQSSVATLSPATGTVSMQEKQAPATTSPAAATATTAPQVTTVTPAPSITAAATAAGTAPAPTPAATPAPKKKASAPATTKAPPKVTAAPQPQPQPQTQAGRYVVGYYAGWASGSGFTPDKVAGAKLTHINYAFAKIDSSLKVAMANPTADLKNFESLRQLKARNSHLKTLISIGGWDYSTLFSDAALTAESREAFAQSCLSFILQHGFDGIDLDWEYPVSGGLAGNVNRPQDRENFTHLLGAIRQKLNEQSGRDGRPYLLTIAVSPSKSFLNKIQLAPVANLVDMLFIMGYDLHGTWDQYADFNAPLYSPTEPSPQYKISVSDAIATYVNAGAPRSKLILGMPFYGHQYSVTSAENNGLFSTFTAAKSVNYDTVVSKYLGDAAYGQFYHATAKVPYVFGNGTFVSYDNPQSITEKVRLAKANGLGGVGAWELSQDRSAALLTAAYNELYQ